MKTIPSLQVALDYISLPAALAMALKVAPAVDIIEIGTPLCKAVGAAAIRAVREVCPDKLILADFKTPDAGGLEAMIAFDAGADMMTIIGGAPLPTVRAAIEVGRQRNKELVMELTGVRDVMARAKEWRDLGIRWLVYHRGFDEEAAHREWSDHDRMIICQLIDMGFNVTVTGGITIELLPFFRDMPISAVIAGRAIYRANDPLAAASELRSAIARLWQGSRG